MCLIVTDSFLFSFLFFQFKSKRLSWLFRAENDRRKINQINSIQIGRVSVLAAGLKNLILKNNTFSLFVGGVWGKGWARQEENANY